MGWSCRQAQQGWEPGTRERGNPLVFLLKNRHGLPIFRHGQAPRPGDSGARGRKRRMA